MDGNLLLSVLGGLGRIAISDDGLETYTRDDDCLGEHPAHIVACQCRLVWILGCIGCHGQTEAYAVCQSASRICSASSGMMIQQPETHSLCWGRLRLRACT